MTMVQRKRAAKLQKTLYLYSKFGRAWLVMLLVALLQITIITISSIAGLNDGECFIAPATVMFTFVQFLVCMFPIGVDNEINEKITQDAYHGSVMAAKFMCSLPFEARDLLNFKIIMWEKAAAVNMLFVTLGHVISLIAESQGYAVYHGVAGLFTLMAIITEIIFIIAFLLKKNILSIFLGVFVGFSFAFACDIMDEMSGMSPDAMSSLKIFSGVSGIIIYIAATLIIAAAGELYIKCKKNVSWDMLK